MSKTRVSTSTSEDVVEFTGHFNQTENGWHNGAKPNKKEVEAKHLDLYS